MHKLVNYFRSNPQAFVLLVIFLVLGIGAFIAVVIALVSAGSVNNNGEPSGAIWLHAAVGLRGTVWLHGSAVWLRALSSLDLGLV